MDNTNQYRIWMRIFIIVILVIISLACWYYQAEKARIRADRYNDIATIAEMKSNELVQWRKERFADVTRAANGPSVIKNILMLAKNPNDPAASEELKKVLEVNRKGKIYDNVFLFSLDGKLILSAKNETDIIDATTQKICTAAIASKEPVFSELFTHNKNITFNVAAISKGADNKPLAVMILQGNAALDLFPLMQSWPTRSASAETIILKREGNNAVVINELRHKSNTSLRMIEPVADKENLLVQVISGVKGDYKGKDYRGIEVLADLRPIPGLPWYMIAKIDTSEVLAEVRYRGWFIALLAFLMSLLTAAIMGFAYRQKQLDIFQGVYKSEQEKRLAEEMYRTTLYSIGDAVITTDKDGNVNQMNRIAEALTGWTEYEASGKPLEEIFHIINEETRQPVGNPAQRVFREGMIVGLANHTLLISRNGVESPIADSAAPIFDDSGINITGVVMVFRDQTQERAAQNDLRESEDRSRTAGIGRNAICIARDSRGDGNGIGGTRASQRVGTGM